MDFVATNLVAICKNSILNGVANSEFNETKVDVKIIKFKSSDKSKGKNLAKFKALAESSRSGFLTPRAR